MRLTLVRGRGSLQSLSFRGVGPLGEEECVEKVVGFVGEASPSREAVVRALEACYDACGRDRKISVVDRGSSRASGSWAGA